MLTLSIAHVEQVVRAHVPKPVTDPAYTRAAVLLALGPDGDDHRVIFTVRTSHVEHHKGEISFPGGAHDPEDSDLAATALRESFEEVGLRQQDVRLLGRLDDFVTMSKFAVTPFVGVFPYPYAFKPFETEVAEILQVPVSHLLDPRNHVPDPRGNRGPDRPGYICYQFGSHVIYGATAIMMKRFLDLVAPQ
ncbi:MAG: CoA pyrophosphatase [Dehalococcoidia bacterium]|nr:CoA pyrophosphatase [Dehalococcoidia bacterium]